jgi:ketopantoate reductase
LTVITALEQAQKPDAILIAAPAWFTAQAIQQLSRFQTPPPLALLHLGYGGLQQAHSAFGPDSTLYACPTAQPTFAVTPDGAPDYHQVQLAGDGGISLGGEHRLAEGLGQALAQAGWHVELGPTAAIQWSGVLWGLQANALSAILNIAPAQVYSQPDLFTHEYDQLREALAVLGRIEASLIALPGVNIPDMTRQLMRSHPADLPTLLADYPRPPSLAEDLRSGTGRSAAAYLNGAIALQADSQGWKTPLNHTLALILTDIAEGRARWADYQANPALLQAQLRLAKS